MLYYRPMVRYPFRARSAVETSAHQTSVCNLRLLLVSQVWCYDVFFIHWPFCWLLTATCSALTNTTQKHYTAVCIVSHYLRTASYCSGIPTCFTNSSHGLSFQSIWEDNWKYLVIVIDIGRCGTHQITDLACRFAFQHDA